MKWSHGVIVSTAVLLAVLMVFQPGRPGMAHDWRTASHESAGIAPDPAVTPEAVVQVYVARAWGWRGYFGVHTWFAVKPAGAAEFTRYEVIGWRQFRNQPVLSINQRPADARWFGSMPEIIADLRGDGVDAIIGRIDAVAKTYPYMDDYQVWPGPNSNTFTAYVARAVPELKVDLPPTAIGKDYLPGNALFATAPSGTGGQFSLFGLLGLMVSAEEGLEINLLGLTFGIDPMDLAIKLPLIGRLAATES